LRNVVGARPEIHRRIAVVDLDEVINVRGRAADGEIDGYVAPAETVPNVWVPALQVTVQVEAPYEPVQPCAVSAASIDTSFPLAKARLVPLPFMNVRLGEVMAFTVVSRLVWPRTSEVPINGSAV
jgi:hypothetical protein